MFSWRHESVGKCMWSEPFEIKNRVKQGGIHVPTLFALCFTMVFYMTFKECEDGLYIIQYRTSGKLFNIRRMLAKTMVSVSLIRDLYTDVCDLVSQTEDDMQRLIDAFASA